MGKADPSYILPSPGAQKEVGHYGERRWREAPRIGTWGRDERRLGKYHKAGFTWTRDLPLPGQGLLRKVPFISSFIFPLYYCMVNRYRLAALRCTQVDICSTALYISTDVKHRIAYYYRCLTLHCTLVQMCDTELYTSTGVQHCLVHWHKCTALHGTLAQGCTLHGTDVRHCSDTVCGMARYTGTDVQQWTLHQYRCEAMHGAPVQMCGTARYTGTDVHHCILHWHRCKFIGGSSGKHAFRAVSISYSENLTLKLFSIFYWLHEFLLWMAILFLIIVKDIFGRPAGYNYSALIQSAGAERGFPHNILAF